MKKGFVCLVGFFGYQISFRDLSVHYFYFLFVCFFVCVCVFVFVFDLKNRGGKIS